MAVRRIYVLSVLAALLCSAPMEYSAAELNAYEVAKRAVKSDQETGTLELTYTPGKGKGYTLKSSDRNSLNLSLWSQLHFAMTNYNDDDGVSSNDPERDLSFYSNATRAYMKGHFWHEDLTYQVSATYRGSKTAGTFSMTDLFLNLKLRDRHLQLRVGQAKVPFLREYNTSTTELFFTSRSLLTSYNKSIVGRDLGLMMHGSFELEQNRLFGYSLAIMDGRGQNNSSSGSKGVFSGGPMAGQQIRESDFLLASRMHIYMGRSKKGKISGEGNLVKINSDLEIEIGVSGIILTGSDSDTSNLRLPDDPVALGDGEDPEINAYSFDFSLSGFNGLMAIGEYVRKTTNSGNAAASKIQAEGYRIHATYMFNETFGSLGARYSFWDPDVESDDNEISEFSIGWNLYLGNQGNTNRLSLNYVNIREKSGSITPKTDQIVAAWQIQL